MDLVFDPAPGLAANRVLLVMLPGVGTSPEAFIEHGFVKALRAHQWPIDVVAAGVHSGFYLDRTLVERIDTLIVGPARTRGYTRIWIVGISLGGMGALFYARAHPDIVEGVILLAPFLATSGAISDVVQAGGFASWQPRESGPEDDEGLLLAWLKAYRPDDARLPKLHLAYGCRDRFAKANGLLAKLLPPHRVFVINGGHDWATWAALWRQVLNQAPFAADIAARK